MSMAEAMAEAEARYGKPYGGPDPLNFDNWLLGAGVGYMALEALDRARSYMQGRRARNTRRANIHWYPASGSARREV